MKRMDQWVNEACGEELKRVKPISVDEQAVLTKTLEKLGLSQEKLPWQEKGTPDFEALEPVLVEYPEPEKKRSWAWRLAQAAVACFALFLVGYMVSPAISGLLGSGGGPGAAAPGFTDPSVQSVPAVSANAEMIPPEEAYFDAWVSDTAVCENNVLKLCLRADTNLDPNSESVQYFYSLVLDGKEMGKDQADSLNIFRGWEKKSEGEWYNIGVEIPLEKSFADQPKNGTVCMFVKYAYKDENGVEQREDFTLNLSFHTETSISSEEAYFDVKNSSGLAVCENNVLKLSLRADTNLNPNSESVQYFYSLALDRKVMDEYQDTSLNSFRRWERQKDDTWLNEQVEIPLAKSFLNQFANSPEEGFLDLVVTYVYPGENGEEQPKQFTQTLTFKLEGDFPKAPVVGNLTGDKTGVEGIISAEQLKAEQEMLEEMLKTQEKAQSNELFHIGNCVVGNVELKNFSVEGESKAAGALVKLLDEKFQDEAELQKVELALYREKDDGTRERLEDHGTQRYISGGDTSIVGCEFKGPVPEETLFLVVTYQEETLAEFPIDVKNQCIDEAAFAEKNGDGVVSAIGGQEARIIITSDDKVYTTGDDTTLTISGNRVKITKAR